MQKSQTQKPHSLSELFMVADDPFEDPVRTARILSAYSEAKDKGDHSWRSKSPETRALSDPFLVSIASVSNPFSKNPYGKPIILKDCEFYGV